MTTEPAPAKGTLPFQLEYLFMYTARLYDPPEVIGPLAGGIRANFYVAEGQVSGLRLRGILRPVGGDWPVVQPDGIVALDVRATIESDDGALIYMTYNGVIDLGEDGYERFLAGEPVADGTAIRAFPRFQTAHPAYQWLNRLACVSVGETLLSHSSVRYEVYAVR